MLKQAARASLAAVALLSVLAAAQAAPEAPKAPRNWRQLESQLRQHNAALVDHGARVSVELLDDSAGMDRVTGPENSFDGNVHTRCVLWGPVRYRVELVDRLEVSRINLLCSDNAGEASPARVKLRLSDGREIEKALDQRVPPRGRWPEPARQTVEINAPLAWVEIEVLDWHAGAVEPRSGKPRMWGGLGEIEVITPADLKAYLVVPDYNEAAPAYLRAASPRNDYAGVSTTMPEPIAAGVHPGIYLTAEEIAAMAETMQSDPRAKPMLEKLYAECDAWLDREVELPDPAVPAQVADRNDDAARAHDYLAKIAGWLGWAYRLGGDERYAAKARDILVGYARLYPEGYKEHRGVNGNDSSKVMAQRLSEAMWLLPLIQSYDMVRGAACFSDAERELVERDLIRCALSFINGKRTAAEEVARRDAANPDWRSTAPETTGGSPIGNWANFYNAAYVQGGIAIDDADWIDLGMANTRVMLARGIGDDGMWGEGAIGYQQFARHALVGCVEPLARRGVDLWGFMDCRFKNLFDSGLKYAYPDGTAPGINDSGRTPIGGSWQAMAYDFAYLRYGDPNYGAIVNAAPRQVFQSSACYFPTVLYEPLPEKPLAGFGSMVFNDLGYGILRGADGGGATYLLMDFGRHGGGHGHPDKLNLLLFADGDELAGEPQGYRYEDSRHRDWTRPSIAHWTLSVDGHAQQPATGKLLCFADAGDVKLMRGVCATAYPGVGLDRTVVQMPGYVLDVYRGWGVSEHAYDYPLCFRGELDALAGIDPERLQPAGPPTQRGYKHIRTLPPVKLHNDWTGLWRREAADVSDDGGKVRTRPASEVRALVLADPADNAATELYRGLVPGDRHQVFFRRRGREATFVTLIDPYKAIDAVASATQQELPGPVPARMITVQRADGLTDLVIVRFDPQADGKPAAPTEFPGGSTDALVAVVRLNAAGTPVRLGIAGGTQLTYKDQHLTLQNPGISFTPDARHDHPTEQ